MSFRKLAGKFFGTCRWTLTKVEASLLSAEYCDVSESKSIPSSLSSLRRRISFTLPNFCRRIPRTSVSVSRTDFHIFFTMSQTELECIPVRPDAVIGPNGESLLPPAGLQQRHLSDPAAPAVPRARAAVVVATVAGISLLNTLGSGLHTVGLPHIAADLNLLNNLLLWPASVFALTASCTLLASGAQSSTLGTDPSS